MSTEYIRPNYKCNKVGDNNQVARSFTVNDLYLNIPTVKDNKLGVKFWI